MLPSAPVLDALKDLVRRTPLAPVVRRLRRLLPADPRTELKRRAKRYDRETVEVMRRVLREDSTGIDVGAHEGSILEEMVRSAPRGRHFAFEPIPDLAAALRRRFPGVEVFEHALADAEGTTSFELVRNKPAYSGLRPRHYDFPDPVIEKITVRVRTLDDVIPSGVEVAFVKIDVEGGEYHVMLGGRETIRRCRPTIVFEAGLGSTGFYGVAPSDLCRLIMVDFGMKLSTMDRWLGGREPYSEEEFVRNWRGGPDFYFIAYDRRPGEA